MSISKVEKKNIPKYKSKCQHDYIRTNGIITCSKCDIKAILYLTLLEK